MKIIGSINESTLLVEVKVEEMREITCWKNPSRYKSWELNLGEGVEVGKEFPVLPAFREAKDLLDTFRGIAPALRQSAKRLEKLAAEVSLHEPDVSLLPKKEG